MNTINTLIFLILEYNITFDTSWEEQLRNAETDKIQTTWK